MNASSMGYPGQRGLYSPAFEHDACGIGMIVDIAGRRSHKIVTQALDILCNLEHRGGAGAEPDTGDGAGILTQLPHAFLERECHLMGITLPAPGRYGVGMLFLSREESRRTAALEKIARDKLSVREADRLVDAMLAAPKDTPGPCRSTVPMVGDVRLFVNTLQHAVDLMTQRGIPAVTSCEQADGFLEYTVRIPTATPAPLPVPNTLPACHEPEMPSGEGSSPGEEDELVRS